MLVKVLEDLFALGLLVIFYIKMALRELLVLRVVLSRDLFVLLPDNVCLCTPVLVLQCLLIVELLLHLIFNDRRINLPHEWN